MSTRAKIFVLASIVFVSVCALLVTESKRKKTGYHGWIEQFSAEKGIDPRLVEAVILAESGHRMGAVSPKGAVGLMQLMPATAREVGAWLGYDEVNAAMLRDPELNLRLGIEYLGWLRGQYDSLELTLAAYNAGPGRVAKWRRDNPDLPPDRLVEEVAFDETRTYVARVLGRYRQILEDVPSS